MKKLFTLFAVSAAFAVLFSCTKEQDQNLDPKQNNTEEPSIVNPSDGDGFSLTLTMPGTKTSFGAQDSEGYPKTWSKDDQIWVNGKISDPLTDAEAGGSSATFHFSEPVEAPFNVVYPASAYSASGITIPATQTFVSGSFDPAADIILGYGDAADNITLSNAVAYLKIRLTKGQYGNFGVKNIKIISAGRKLNGTFAIDGSSHTALTVPTSTAEESEQSITLDASGIAPLLSDTPVEFLIAVAPQTLNSLSVTVEDMKGNKQTKNKASSTTPLTAGKILAQPAFAFDEYVAIKTPLDLLAFANSCAGDSNYYVVKANIDMTGETWPMAGTGDASDTAFNGVFDGGNNGTEDGGFKITNLTSTTGAFINFLYSSGTVKNVTLTGSISNADDVSSKSYCCVGMVGMSRGNIEHCYNRAAVSCTVTYGASSVLYVGGIVGRHYRMGAISHCYNYGTVSCVPTGGSANVHVGGIAGCLQRTASGDKSSIDNCTNAAAVTANPPKESLVHVGGVIGYIWTVDGTTSKMTLTKLVNTADVTRSQSERLDAIPALVGGLIGGVHGEAVSGAASELEVTDSHVSGCTVYNGHFNNDKSGYGSEVHTGGFVGLVRGKASAQKIVFKDNCYVNDVIVSTRRGNAGGFVSWARGVKIDDCDVLASAVGGYQAQCWYAGGIAGCAYDAVISNCIVTLTKDGGNGTTLYSQNNSHNNMMGGIAAWTRGTTSITDCKAFVSKMYSAVANMEDYRGWIAGTCSGTTTISNCGLGGSYVKTNPFTLDNDNTSSYYFGNYIYGSSSSGVTATGCYYWDGN